MTLPPPPPPPLGHDKASDADPYRLLARTSWGLGDVWTGLLLSQVAALVVAAVLLSAGDWDFDDSPLWVTGLAALALQAVLITVSLQAASYKGLGAVTDFGIRMVKRDIGIGLLVGVGSQLFLVPAITFPILWATGGDTDDVSRSATELTDRATTPLGVIVLVLAVGVTAPIVEEIFFRGLMFRAFRKRHNFSWLESFLGASVRPDTSSSKWNLRVAFVMSSLIFGAIHFQLILFPALSAVGAVFAWLAHRYGRLGPAIWAHMAFNGTTLLVLLAL